MKSLIIGLALVLLLGHGRTGAEPVTVRNEKPQESARTVQLHEQWTVGGEEGEVIFGMMIDSLEDQEANVYLLDAQLCRIEVFSPKGEHLRTISAEGDGPGEVRNPQDMIMMPDGKIGILELFPAKFVTLYPDGTPGDQLPVGGDSNPQTGFSVGFQAVHRGSSLVIAAQRSKLSDVGQRRTQYLARIGWDGEEKARFREQTVDLDFSQLRFVETDLLPPFLLANTVGPDGRVYTVRDRDEYAIEVYEPDGSLAMVIEREFENLKRDKDSVRRFSALIDAWATGFPGEIIKDIEDVEPAITEMHVDDEGVLWVLHSRSGLNREEGVFLTYDTFSPEGKWLREVSFRADADPLYDGLRFLSGNRVLLVKGYVLARWASRGAKNVDFGEGSEASVMEVTMCQMKDVQ